MTEEALGRYRGTRQVYIRQVSNAELEKKLDILQNFEPQNKESITALESLRGELTNKIDTIKNCNWDVANWPSF